MSLEVGCWFAVCSPSCLGSWGVSRLCSLLGSSQRFDCKLRGFVLFVVTGCHNCFSSNREAGEGLYPDGGILSERKDGGSPCWMLTNSGGKSCWGPLCSALAEQALGCLK